jgi:hypothetical protein
MHLGKMRGITAAFSSGELTATGAEALYDTTVTIQYAINGKIDALAAITDGTAITVDANGDAFTALAASQGCTFVWGVELGGTVLVVMQSEVRDLDADTDDFKSGDLPQFPVIPDTMCPIAYQVVKNGSTGSAWTFGTSNWNATGITDLIVNVSTLPDRPQNETTA